MTERTFTAAEFLREVKDKLGVVFHGCNALPTQREIHRQQCEDFLVKFYTDAITAASEREAALREENERLQELADSRKGRRIDDALRITAAESALTAERQKIKKLFTWVIETERQYNLNRGGFITATDVFKQLISLGFVAPALSPTEPTP